MRLSLLFATTALAGAALVAGCSDGGMFGRSSTATPSPAAQQAAGQGYPAADVREVQQQLKSLGYYDGQIDGVWGPETQVAIQQYRRDRGMAVSSGLDAETRASLRETTAGRQQTQPTQQTQMQQRSQQTGQRQTSQQQAGQQQAGQGQHMGIGRAQDVSPAAGPVVGAAIAPRNLSAANIRAIQSRLATEGHYRASVDGVWGPQSRDALVNFQTQNQLRADGLLDPRTANALDLDYQMLGDSGWTSTQPGSRNVRQRARDTTGEGVGSQTPGPGPSPTVPRQ